MNRTKTIVVSSGKGGVGKTISSISICLCLQKNGLRPILIDGDLSLANVDVLLGVHSRYNIGEVLSGKAGIRDIIATAANGLKIIPASSGVSKLSQTNYGISVWKRLLQELESIADVLVVDSAAGLNHDVITFNNLADLNLLVTTPDPHSITDGYALLKTLKESHALKNAGLIVNQVNSISEGLSVSNRIGGVSQEFLATNIAYYGSIPYDRQLSKIVRYKTNYTDLFLNTCAGQAYRKIAYDIFQNINKSENQLSEMRSLNSFAGQTIENLEQIKQRYWERSA